ncbi:MAG: GyrI-like domain-containing protein [Verrucomicrobiia bacterium]
MKQPDIVRREGFLVMGTVTRRKPESDRPEMVASIWKQFEAYHESIKGHSLDSKYYGVSFAAAPDGSFDYLAGMAVRVAGETPNDLEVRQVPAATYAVFACPVQSIGQTYRYIFSEWRAQSGHETDNSKPAFEEYPPAAETNAPVLLHIPIRERRAG